MPRSIAMLIRHCLVAATTSTSIAATAELMCLIRGPYSIHTRIPTYDIKFHLPATRPISCLARRTHTSRCARRPRLCILTIYDIHIYISAYCIYIFYILWNSKHRSGHLIRLMLMNWRWRHDAISSIRQIQGARPRDGERERGCIYWNCENQKFHSFSYKSVNVCHLSKRPPISTSATHSTWSDIQLQLRFAYELKTSTLKNIYFDFVFVFSLSLCFGFLF